jgi:hypothetical protein
VVIVEPSKFTGDPLGDSSNPFLALVKCIYDPAGGVRCRGLTPSVPPRGWELALVALHTELDQTQIITESSGPR